MKYLTQTIKNYDREEEFEIVYASLYGRGFIHRAGMPPQCVPRNKGTYWVFNAESGFDTFFLLTAGISVVEISIQEQSELETIGITFLTKARTEEIRKRLKFNSLN